MQIAVCMYVRIARCTDLETKVLPSLQSIAKKPVFGYPPRMTLLEQADSLVKKMELEKRRFNRYEVSQIHEARQKVDDREHFSLYDLGDLQELAERLD